MESVGSDRQTRAEEGKMETNEWLTVAEAARHAKCGARSIYLAVKQGKLRAARLGGRREPSDDVGGHRVDSPTH